MKLMYLSLYLQELRFNMFVLAIILVSSIAHCLVDTVDLRLRDFTLLNNLPLGSFAVLRHFAYKLLDLSIKTLQCLALDSRGLHGIFEESCDAFGQVGLQILYVS